MLSKPSKAQATPLQALSSSCEMENREQQNRFLQPIQDSDRQGDRNPKVFLKAKVIPASSQLNPDRYKIFKFSGQPSSNPKLGTPNSAQQFGFGARDYLTPDLNFSEKLLRGQILNT